MEELKKLSKESILSNLTTNSYFNETFKKHCVSIDFTFELINDDDLKILDEFYKALYNIQLKKNIIK